MMRNHVLFFAFESFFHLKNGAWKSMIWTPQEEDQTRREQRSTAPISPTRKTSKRTFELFAHLIIYLYIAGPSVIGKKSVIYREQTTWFVLYRFIPSAHNTLKLYYLYLPSTGDGGGRVSFAGKSTETSTTWNNRAIFVVLFPFRHVPEYSN